MALRSSGEENGQVCGLGWGSGGGGATLGPGLGLLALRAGAPAASGRGRGLSRTGSGAGRGAGLGALLRWKMLHAGPWPPLGRCMPRGLLAMACRLAVRSFRVRSVSVGHDIQRCVCVTPCLRT